MDGAHFTDTDLIIVFPNFQIFPQIIWCYPPNDAKG